MTITEDMIRRKAYQLWEALDCPAGSAETDWYAARHLLLEGQETSCEPGTPVPEDEPRYGLRKLDPS